MSVGWVLPRKDAYDQFAKRVITSLLVDGSNSPMYHVCMLHSLSSTALNQNSMPA